jgi:1-pyrroline-5-carboxylate dehydrogenase
MVCFNIKSESADIQNAAFQSIRSAFEYNGQKCSACSRVYVPDRLFDEFKKILLEEHQKIKQGEVDGKCIITIDFTNHMTAVIHKQSYDNITKYIKDVKDGTDNMTSIIAGGGHSDSKGYYIEPTILVTKDPKSATMVNELFGPVMTIYVYPAEELDETLELADTTSNYALTLAIFAQDREAIIKLSNRLRNAGGNFYINDKCTGAVVGQQPFGGGRMSGTNDKGGSYLNLLRWTSPRTIKESFVSISGFGYPSNMDDSN